MPGRRNAADSRVELDVNESFTPGYSDDQVMLLEAVAKKTGRSIVLTDKLEGDVNGVFGKDGKIYINADMENSDYMISVALHGLRDSAPAEYNALEKFVVNYLVESGESVDEMLDDIKTKWKQDAPSEDIRREELVAQTVMALAGNERTLKTAVECKANRDLLKKALDAIKRIAQGVRTWIEGIKKGDRITGAHNKQAQPWIEDVKALEKLAKMFSEYMDEQRVAVQETTQERNQGGVRYSIIDKITDDNGNVYNNVVLLDTNVFKGQKPRNWGKVLIKFVYNNLAGKQVVVYDENESGTIIEFARTNERVLKDGAKNPHKVIDKLARKRDLNSQLAVAHSKELVYVSNDTLTETNEKKHQWLDENGWTYRQAFLMKKDGSILSANLNIAHTKDGRNLLYDINKITVIGHGVVPSNSKSRGSHINTNNGKNNISQQSEKSNTHDGKKSVDDTIYDFKEKQNRIIQRSNPVDDDYHTWIRNAGDIKTFEETLSDSDYDEGEDFDRSYSWNMAQRALKSGKITVYSSYPISQGVFVTPSKMEAEDYAGGGRIFKKTVNLTDVAWIDPTQGQFAKVDGDETIKHNDLRFAVDDEITDDLFSFDGDLFEEDNTKYLDEYIKTSPQEAVLSMYNSLAKTGESVVRGFKGVKLDEGNYLKAARRLMKRYQIKQSLNPGIDSDIAQRIKEFVTEVNDNPNANYSEALNVLATDCKRFLLMSGDYDDTAKEIREQILGEIRGSTILLRPYEESQILESFGGMKNLKRAFFGKVNVGYERNKKKGGTYWYIEELVEHIREQLGKAYADESAVDSIEGWKNDYALKNDVHPFVVSYLSFKPAALHTQKAEEENMLFATPRSWVRVSDILHYDSNVENPVVRHKIIGNIGAAEGVQFVEHCKKQKRAVTADDFISGKVDAPKSPDMLFLLTNSVTSKADFIAQKDFSDFTPDEKKRLRDIISALFRMPVPDYTVIGVKELLSKNRTAVKQTFVTMDDIRIRRFLADNAEAFGLSREKGGRARLAMWGD